MQLVTNESSLSYFLKHQLSATESHFKIDSAVVKIEQTVRNRMKFKNGFFMGIPYLLPLAYSCAPHDCPLCYVIQRNQYLVCHKKAYNIVSQLYVKDRHAFAFFRTFKWELLHTLFLQIFNYLHTHATQTMEVLKKKNRHLFMFLFSAQRIDKILVH